MAEGLYPLSSCEIRQLWCREGTVWVSRRDAAGLACGTCASLRAEHLQAQMTTKIASDTCRRMFAPPQCAARVWWGALSMAVSTVTDEIGSCRGGQRDPSLNLRERLRGGSSG